MNYDIFIFNFINGFATRFGFLDMLGIFLAKCSPYFLGILLLFFLFWPKEDKEKNRAMVLVAIMAGLIARFLLKSIILLFYSRPRPYVSLPSAHKLISTIASDNFQSFPSGHAIFFFALSTVIYKFNKKLGILFFSSSILMGVARVFTGVHWLSDIVGGLVLGILVGVIAHWAYVKNQDILDRVIAKVFRGIDRAHNRF